MSPNYHPQVNDPLSPLQAGFVLTAISSEFRTPHLRSQGPLPGVGPWIVVRRGTARFLSPLGVLAWK